MTDEDKNIYKPEKVTVRKIEELSSDTKLFRLVKANGSSFEKKEDGLVFRPGQFVLAGLFGYGEAPFGAASSPYQTQYLDIIVRKVGTLTSALHQLEEGQSIFLRGPYGNGFPLERIQDKSVLMITGGCGLPPIAALTEYIIHNQDKFNPSYLIYGAKTPADLLLKEKLEEWSRSLNVLLTVDEADNKWQGSVGLVSGLLDQVKVDPVDTVATMCGPGPMIGALEKILKPMGITDKRIFVSLERRMQCGVGKCQHCAVGDKYVCKDGPVFNIDEIDQAWD